MKPSWVNRRRDENEPAIISDLEEAGFQVERSLPTDLLLRHRATGRLALLEVQGVSKRRRRDKKQLEVLNEWNIPIVKSTAEALAVLHDPQFFGIARGA